MEVEPLVGTENIGERPNCENRGKRTVIFRPLENEVPVRLRPSTPSQAEVSGCGGLEVVRNGQNSRWRATAFWFLDLVSLSDPVYSRVSPSLSHWPTASWRPRMLQIVSLPSCMARSVSPYCPETTVPCGTATVEPGMLKQAPPRRLFHEPEPPCPGRVVGTAGPWRCLCAGGLAGAR